MKLIVGLGNPGRQYQNTRHNIGFMFLDYYLKDKQLSDVYLEKFNGLYKQEIMFNEKVIFFKPLTYMNLSGEAISAIIQFFHIELNDLLVIYDDMDLPFGHLRLRLKGNAGGHNGIKNILQHLNSNNFARVRVGIDRPQFSNNIDYVLSKFNDEEINVLNTSFKNVTIAVDCFIKNQFELAMNRLNSNTTLENNNE